MQVRSWGFCGIEKCLGVQSERSGYYPTDANGLAVQSEAPYCLCYLLDIVCAPLGYGGCEGGQCEGAPPALPPDSPKGSPLGSTNLVYLLGIPIYGNWCGPGHPAPGAKYGNCLPGSTGKLFPNPPAIDWLDSCCCKHDQCYDDHGCNNICIWFTCPCARCDKELADCAWSTFCADAPNKIKCIIARGLIITYMLEVAKRCPIVLFP